MGESICLPYMPQFNFSFGNKKPSMKDMLIISGVLAFVVTTIAEFTNLPKQKIWCAIDQITRPLNNDTLEQVKLKIDEVIACRAEKAVGDAIDKYKKKTGWKPVEILPPRYSEQPVDTTVCYTDECKSLGGEMRLCAPWLDTCPKQ